MAYDTNSLFLGIALGVIKSIALTELFECMRTLEDPFFSNSGWDRRAREELVVLAHQELMVARKMLFPKADDFVLTRDWFGDDNTVVNCHRNSSQHKDRKSRHHSVSLFEKRSKSPGYSAFDPILHTG